MAEESKVKQQANDENWERDTLIKIATSSLKEQRRARRWGIFFKLLTFAYLFLLLVIFGEFEYGDTDSGKKHTALVKLEGIIAEGQEAGADNVVKGLRDAFKDDNTAGVVLRINSPGGTAVQSSLISDEITRLRKKYPDIPLYAVITDVAASGAYWVASAADKIYANKASVVGSIGVRMDSFGFVDAIEKLGIERRLLVAGDHKALLDPFLPLSDTEMKHVQELLDELHNQFITAIKKGRGDRLKTNDTLFSGLIWSGEESLDLGLVDDLGSAGHVAREVIGEDKVVDFTKKRDWIERFSERFGSGVAQAIENRLLQPSLR